MISISKSKSMSDAREQQYFKAKVTKDVADIVDAMLYHCWSPIVWEGGLRRKSKFMSCEWIALDFDDGNLTLDAALDYLKTTGTEGIIGTTKSHLKEKTTLTGTVMPACDRFRLLMPASHKMVSVDMYEYNMLEVMKQFPTCDKSCKDGGRFFFPCKEITHIRTGKKYPVDVGAVAKQHLEAKQQQVREYSEEQSAMIKGGIMPSWVVKALMGTYPAGGRHKVCYRIGATLAKADWQVTEIIKLFRQSSLLEIGNIELKRAVENGWQAGRSEQRKSFIDGKKEEAEERPQLA
jgi:hypothetical protein